METETEGTHGSRDSRYTWKQRLKVHTEAETQGTHRSRDSTYPANVTARNANRSRVCQE